MIPLRPLLTASLLLGLAPLVLTAPAAAQSRSRIKEAPSTEAPATAPATNVPKANPRVFPTGITWIAESIEGKPLPAGTEAGFKLNAQFRAEGFSGCNTFSAAAYPQKEQGFIVGPIAMTKRACAGNEAALEKVFLPAFKFSVGWSQDNESQLTIKTRAGTLRFRRGV